MGLHSKILLQLLLLLPDMVGFLSVLLQVLHHMPVLQISCDAWPGMEGEKRGGDRGHIARDGVQLLSFLLAGACCCTKK